ncbi:brix domain-containing protein peter pan [Oratosquilla oratoria]|uniref:brix domain-containing protein peter pan n=1 Tax=Oratosquilla oratoria TaxID=337810 RepID=UPI003F776DCA
MPKKKRGKLTKRNKALALARKEDEEKAPHSFVIHRGKVGKYVKQLQTDFRRVMQPNTAINLRERKSNSLKDFIAMAGPLNVTHLVSFSHTTIGVYMKLCRMPRGPTLTFKVENYSLVRDVVTQQKRQMTYGKQFLHPPCLMTNLQPQQGPNHLQLTARLFLDLFPTITPNKTKVQNIRRCCMVHYDEEMDCFDFRHYSIRVVPVGVSRAVKKFMSNKIPDLGKFSDVSDFMIKSEVLSESEGEDDPAAQVTVANKLVRGKAGPQKSTVKLTEIGPRMTLKLLKVEEGPHEGAVLFHQSITKTAEEKRLIEKSRQAKKKKKEQRKQKQQNDVARKASRKEEHKQKCLDGMKLSQKQEENEDYGEEDDDAAYYREEVGVDPDEDLFKGNKRSKKYDSNIKLKKRKSGGDEDEGPEGRKKLKKKPMTVLEKMQETKKRKEKMKEKKKSKRISKKGHKRGGVKKK